MVKILVARFYDEKKAKRVNQFHPLFQQRLNTLLKTRTKREQELKKELDAIAASYVDLKCTKCNALIRVKFTDWQNGKFNRICNKCVRNKIHKDLCELYKQIQPFLPEGYEIKYDRYEPQTLEIRKKKE
jgi:hypothetical protein